MTATQISLALALLLATHHPLPARHAAACAHKHHAAPAASSDSGKDKPVASPDQPAGIATFNRDFARRIKPGMALEKVEALVGSPGNNVAVTMPDIIRSVYWIGEHHTNFSVNLDARDHVISWDLLEKDGKSYGMDKTGKMVGPY